MIRKSARLYCCHCTCVRSTPSSDKISATPRHTSWATIGTPAATLFICSHRHDSLKSSMTPRVCSDVRLSFYFLLPIRRGCSTSISPPYSRWLLLQAPTRQHQHPVMLCPTAPSGAHGGGGLMGWENTQDGRPCCHIWLEGLAEMVRSQARANAVLPSASLV